MKTKSKLISLIGSISLMFSAVTSAELDRERHSGTYDLDYTYESDIDFEFFNTDIDYLDTQHLMLGSIHGAVGMISPLGSFLLPFNIWIPLAELSPEEVAKLDIGEADTIAEFDAVIDNADWEFWWFGELVSYHNHLAPGDFATVAEREAAKDLVKEKSASNITAVYDNIRRNWDGMHKYLPEHTNFATLYNVGDKSNEGIAGFSYEDESGGWLAFLDDNQRVALPFIWPVNAFLIGGMTPWGPAGVGCLAWIAADEVGCFEELEGESGGQCTQNPYLFPEDPQPVDAAFQAMAISELTCIAAAPGIVFGATFGFGLAAAPTGELRAE